MRSPSAARTLIAIASLLAAAVSVRAGQADLRQRVRGVAIDATGAVLPSAPVVLVSASNEIARTTTDASGAFSFDSVPAGRYEIRVAFDGFQPTTARVTVGSRPPGPVRVTLPLANVTQEITVSTQSEAVTTTASANGDAVTVDASMLEALPVFDQDLIGGVSRFLDAGSLGNGGATVVVNGMEVSALRVSASAVQQIKINQDPYSAEYARPGRGRIEILTKPGSAEFHGEVNLIARDAAFDARNAFATSKPDERRRTIEGVYGGPVGGRGKTSFLLSGHDRLQNQQAFIFAVGLSGAIQDVAPQRDRESLIAGSLTHQKSDKTTISIRGNYQYEAEANRGVGGTTLQTAGVDFSHHEQQIAYTQQTAIRPTLFGQVQVLAGHEREPSVSLSPSRAIVVAGAFTAGGGQGDQVRTETHTQMTASLTWTKGRHLLQSGFQLPDWSRRGFYDRTNFGGTFYFADLGSYAAGRPYSFVQQQGKGDVVVLEKQVGTYVKDDWQAGGGVTLSMGLRYDWQNYFHDANNLAPRGSIAYAPGKTKANVIRAGAGVFNDRSGPGIMADLLHYRPGGLVKYVITDPSYPDPFQAAAAAAQPTSLVQLAPDVRIPQTVQYSLGLDRLLTKTSTVSITYTGSHGNHAFRSRDINAPPPPLYLARPDPLHSTIREVESNGRQTSDSLSVLGSGSVRVGPRHERHERPRLVSGQRLRPVGRIRARRLRSPAPREPARPGARRRRRRYRPGVQRELGGTLHTTPRPGYLPQRTRPRAAGRRRPQYARCRAVREPRHPLLASGQAREGRINGARADDRHRRVQRHQPRELWQLRRDDQLPALRPAHQRARGAPAAVLGARETLTRASPVMAEWLMAEWLGDHVMADG
jgi:carboxypeptidase family protein